MQVAIYSRESDMITFQGHQEWDSAEQALEYFCRADETPETEAMVGWPNAAVVWYGDTGIGQ